MDEDHISMALFELIAKDKPGLTDDEVLAEYDRFFKSHMEELSDKLLVDLERGAKRDMRKIVRFRKGFERRLKSRWKVPLEMLYTDIERCLTEGKAFNDKFRNQAVDERDYVFEALTRLHGKAVQLSFEILALLENGCADGAFARWRTLYETSIFALLIEENGQETAERYLNYLFVEEYHFQEEMRQFESEMDDQLPPLKEKVDQLSEKYGKEFRSKKYGWLAHLFNSDERNMRTFQKRVKMGYASELYKSACANVHSGPDSLYKSLGFLEDSQTQHLIVSGPSNYGLALPGQMTAASLAQVTVTLLLSRPNMDRIVLCNAIDKYTVKVQRAFDDCQASLAAAHIERYGDTSNTT